VFAAATGGRGDYLRGVPGRWLGGGFPLGFGCFEGGFGVVPGGGGLPGCLLMDFGAGFGREGEQKGRSEAQSYQEGRDFEGQGCVRLRGWNGGVCAHSVLKGARTPEHL